MSRFLIYSNTLNCIVFKQYKYYTQSRSVNLFKWPSSSSSFVIMALGKLTYSAFPPPTEMECGASMRSVK